MPALDNFSHVSLTVSDPGRSARFYNKVLGTETVRSFGGNAGERLEIVARGNMMLALRDHPETPDQSFDPCRIGLDHVALQVPSRDELEAWHASLLAEGVTCSAIEPSPFGLHLNLKDPDGIAIELFTPSP
ncbi:catechol 2,3-dioxygenase-like lactoylglutathione lyase family enzyme [Kribbella rubisoli]|uniref:Catechol 2,3-dioxygenase-like lactoylglutathione lyase family enzyme n=1 Tax=Kribbella rubisoli TaxID=3075929 RepID=A0A4Q7VYV3_9ACTN|nr:VOC family protein [Kribbella rubisoli]RZU01910.1 catechol 2,3-dioxygenase-like lactoylglutathione lyase family enzyme [Kribbella rubisoli]